MPLDTFMLANLRADRDALVAAIEEAGGSVRGAGATCPWHADRRPSASLFCGDDGAWRVRCHVCNLTLDVVDVVQRARGLGLREALAALTNNNNGRNGKSPGAKSTFPTLDDAVANLASRHGPVAAMWTYHNADGQPVGAVARWNRAGDKKDIRPLARVAGGWIVGSMPTPRPLYNLPALLVQPTKRVYIVEGEKVADAAASIGLLTTTSAGGANAAKSTNWSPLAGREVVILPDLDEPGEKYARDVAAILAEHGARVRIVRLPGLPPGGDLHNFMNELRDGQDADTIRAEIEALADAAAAERGADGVPIEDLLSELMAAVREGRPAVPSLQTGIELLDQAGGLACGEFLALFGPPGVGKSLLADAIALGVLDETPETTALVFSLETAPIVRVARLACGRSVAFNQAGGVDRCVPLRATLDGKLEPYTIERLATVAAGLTDKYRGRLHFIDDATTATEIARRVRMFRPSLVLVDHVGLLTPESENATFALDVGLNTLQDALRETKAAGLFIAEVDKGSLKSGAFGLDSLRGSARIASLAGMVAALAPNDDTPDGFDPGLRLQLLKARHGRAWVEQTGSLLGGLGLVQLVPGAKPIERKKKRKPRACD